MIVSPIFRQNPHSFVSFGVFSNFLKNKIFYIETTLVSLNIRGREMRSWVELFQKFTLYVPENADTVNFFNQRITILGAKYYLILLG